MLYFKGSDSYEAESLPSRIKQYTEIHSGFNYVLLFNEQCELTDVAVSRFDASYEEFRFMTLDEQYADFEGRSFHERFHIIGNTVA